jgi:hypothetical protein
MAGRIAYYGGIVTNGLVLNLDAGKPDSYNRIGTTWRDISGNGNNGTLTNGPTFNSTNGGSLVFDGSNHVTVTGSITTSAATFIAWIYRNGVQTAWSGLIFSRATNTTGMNLGSALFEQTHNTLGYHWNDSRFDWNSGLITPNSAWCMCAISVSSTNAIAYLCQSSGITSATNNTSHSSTTINSIRLAQDSFDTRYFKGNIAIAQIYNRNLSSTEIEQNFNAQKSRFGL